MTSAWDIFSSSFTLAIFIGVVLAFVKIMRTINSSTTSTVSELRSKGVSYENGKLKITTDQAPPSRQEYIASTQRAFEKGAKQMSLHPEAFKTGPNRESSAERTEDAIAEGKSSSVDTPERKAFQRPKKLD